MSCATLPRSHEKVALRHIHVKKKSEFYNATLVVSFQFELNFCVFYLQFDKDEHGYCRSVSAIEMLRNVRKSKKIKIYEILETACCTT
jgi:hypothetical protein